MSVCVCVYCLLIHRSSRGDYNSKEGYTTHIGSSNPMNTIKTIFLKNKFIYFIYLFLTALGLCCCARAFSSCGEWGLLFVAVQGLLIAVASLVAEDGL